MYTELVNASDRCVQDDILCARLAGIRCLPSDGLPSMRFGLKGPRGTIYRLIEAQTLMEAVRLCEILREMGFAHDPDGPVLKQRPVHRTYQLRAHLAWPELPSLHRDDQFDLLRHAAARTEHARQRIASPAARSGME